MIGKITTTSKKKRTGRFKSLVGMDMGVGVDGGGKDGYACCFTWKGLDWVFRVVAHVNTKAQQWD